MMRPIQCNEVVMCNDENRNRNQDIQNKNDYQIPRTFYPEFFFQLLISKFSEFYHSTDSKS